MLKYDASHQPPFSRLLQKSGETHGATKKIKKISKHPLNIYGSPRPTFPLFLSLPYRNLIGPLSLLTPIFLSTTFSSPHPPLHASSLAQTSQRCTGNPTPRYRVSYAKPPYATPALVLYRLTANLPSSSRSAQERFSFALLTPRRRFILLCIGKSCQVDVEAPRK
jgi:hypothetical protein